MRDRGRYELSATERHAVILMAQGATREGMASAMGLGLSTASKVLRRIYDKTGTKNTTAAVAILVARGDLRPAEFIDGMDSEFGGKASELIHVRIVTELDSDKLAGLGDAYRCLARAGL